MTKFASILDERLNTYKGCAQPQINNKQQKLKKVLNKKIDWNTNIWPNSMWSLTEQLNDGHSSTGRVRRFLSPSSKKKKNKQTLTNGNGWMQSHTNLKKKHNFTTMTILIFHWDSMTKSNLI